jgi:hypothetical protein
VKPALSDHVWAKKERSLNGGDLLIEVEMHCIATFGTERIEVVFEYRWSQGQVLPILEYPGPSCIVLCLVFTCHINFVQNAGRDTDN